MSNVYNTTGNYANVVVTPSEERFWNKVNKTETCWIWTAATIHNRGYGAFYDGNKIVLAHRYSFELHYGKFDDNLIVCHKCDNPRCVNPEHLFLGTQHDNIMDAEIKGRMNHHGAKGESNGNSKLTNPEVKEIKEFLKQGVPGIEISRAFNVHHSVIYDIKNHKIWNHITI